MSATREIAARRYRIERYLTEGGMGAIYIGKKLGPGGFEKEVVLKQLLPEYTSRPEFRDLFFREAKISATLDHVNIVHTFDLVESDESLFIVMEYVRGADLRTIIRRAKYRRCELSVAAAIHVALEILAGLSYAHRRRNPSGASLGIIHRDVSPSNILCSAHGEVKLSDFGIAKAATHASVFYRVRGKVGYMSPEQARNEAIDPRTDLYSLAVCLYEALTVERLFVGDLSTPPDVIYGQPLLPPSQKRRGLPADMDRVLLKALSINANERYQDAGAFAEALRQVAHRHNLLFSAPQLAEHLREVLGSDPGRWLQDDKGDPSDSETHKLPTQTMEGKEAASLGIVEGANLYVVSGGDVVSPNTVAPPPKAASDGGAMPRTASETTRKVADPLRAADLGSDPFISVADDDEEPTRLRDSQAAAARHRLPAPGGPRGSVVPAARSAPAARPVPAGSARPRPVPVGAHPASASPPARLRIPPPPPRGAAPAPRPPTPDSPFEAADERDQFPATPPPLPMAGAAPARALAPSFVSGPPRSAPPSDPPGFGPVNLQHPADSITFRTEPPVPLARRAGPPGLLVLLVMLAAVAGGAKLAAYVTRADLGTGTLLDSR
ncbi:MAG TPA: protein kinase [Polyangia bacterium]|nr:protein kinase [Polyangia bacterium]